MAEKKKNKVSQYVVWGVLAVLAFSLIGFGTGGFGGLTRNVGTVGDQEITTDAYGQALQNEMRTLAQRVGEPVPMARARDLGLDRLVLSRLVATAALDDEAERLGISVGDARVAEELRAEPAFQGASGFDREAYAFALRNIGLTEAQYEEQLRRDATRLLMQQAITGGVAAPQGYVDAIVGYVAETRDLSWAIIPPTALVTGIAEPTEDELAAWYGENGERFRRPETKAITYLELSPATLADGIEVEADRIAALFEERREGLNRPERRIVDRLNFPDLAAAEAALERIRGGESFDRLVDERGLDLADVDQGEVTRADLGDAADAVFALEDLGVTEVVETPLGPALYRVNGVLNPVEVTLDALSPDLGREIALRDAAAEVDDAREPLDDLLAGGATLEEAATEIGAEIGTVDWFAGVRGGLAGDAAFSAAAASATEDDFPDLIDLAGGGLAALRVDGVTPSAVPPLDEVRDEALNAMREGLRVAALEEIAQARADALEAGGTIDETVSTEAGLRRDGSIADAPAGMVAAAFDIAEGAATVVSGGGQVAVVRVDAVTPPDPENLQVQIVQAAAEGQAAQGIASDILDAYVTALQARAEVRIDASAIQAVQAQIP